MLARTECGLASAISDTMPLHERQTNNEIHSVATKPMSISISGSSSGTGGCWLWRPGVQTNTEKGVNGAESLRGLAFVERHLHRLLRYMARDAALALADAALGHDVPDGRLALAAAGSDAEFELQLVEGVRAFRHGSADFAVGNGLAHANDHDSWLLPGKTLMRTIIISFRALGKWAGGFFVTGVGREPDPD
jgi:hypothetical protein